MNILFVEDDFKYQTVIKELLELEGYTIHIASNVADGLTLFKQNKYELVITDYDMDDVDGLQFIHLVQKIDSHVKIIMLTGIDDAKLELKSLELNVADFIKKPVDFEVLLKRIEIALRKKDIKKMKKIESELNNIQIDLERRHVTQNGKKVSLTLTEYNLLVFLMQHKNSVKSREEMLKAVWRNNKSIDIRAVDTHIKNLRAKIDISCIYSIRGVGYEWVEEN